jgi:hypothetical protein
MPYIVMNTNQKVHALFAIGALSALLMTGLQYQQYSYGQSNQTSSANEQGFRSQFDTFVTSEPRGYGMYDERESNVFAPGETFLLYIEPVGYAYGNVTDEEGNQLYTMNFTVDFVISDPDGTVLGGQEGLPIGNLVSHHQNKELNLDIKIDQTSPFPPGDYIITYTVTDENSGESFDIRKDVTIQG